ncbi:hypothetical protein [Vibrio parahaemolyticus]|uniref:hypothetical protein n=1 Tax=Vibrio parahaemolyticus TaxID=670 RepID=UPI00215258F9|nr:hypothetical protein [Vibrio parahaemolyticus]
MKPRRTCNAEENRLTTPKSAFVPIISQCGGSTKSLKPRSTYTTKENCISASKSAFKTTNSPSIFSASNVASIVQTASKNKEQVSFRLLKIEPEK